ncbi:FecR family protein [Sphingopyxis sp. H115]|uniref:FecR family protein n=1 Tax=Sphingopyxis sp. H115 TaxID=1759073 RepID=UPI000735E1A3|nr:FecR domain-containing protein [Sphingopyxis sp. H115]KTE17799.1 hypothetical protein ATE71_01505 [Sphingopyxis sp. H115]
MNDNDEAKPDDDAFPRDDALSWSIRMRGDVSESLQEEFEQWLAASPGHRQAYNRYSRVIAQAEILKSSAQPSELTETKPVARPRIRWLMVGAAAAAVIVFAITIRAGGTPIPATGVVQSAYAAEPLVTDRGEIRSFKLADGSMATLDSDTKVEVSISHNTRYVRVAQGRARVKVVSDVRPFRVEAGQGFVTTNEGVIDVMISGDRQVVVELFSGKADLASASRAADAAPRSLRTGTALVYNFDDQQIHSAPRSSFNSANWPSGWAEHRSIPLSQLVSEANRYASVPIVLDDPKIGNRNVSGRFKISDTEMFLKRIADLFDLTIHERLDGTYLRSK